MGEWYYTRNGKQRGPVSPQELRDMVVQGTLVATDMIWKDGQADWIAASSAVSLFPVRTPLPLRSATGRTTRVVRICAIIWTAVMGLFCFVAMMGFLGKDFANPRYAGQESKLILVFMLAWPLCTLLFSAPAWIAWLVVRWCKL